MYSWAEAFQFEGRLLAVAILALLLAAAGAAVWL
jgi:hypothetical protein